MGKKRLRLWANRARRKHPHGRGEEDRKRGESPGMRETPPRAWGRMVPSAWRMIRLRNTPTGVGKNLPTSNPCKFRRKHPHGRGEEWHAAKFYLGESETPPRAWGRSLSKTQMHKSPGNTPTGVGKNQLSRLVSGCLKKHPHGRGEEGYIARPLWQIKETPPRAWGRIKSSHIVVHREGNTPTGVGKNKAASCSSTG